MHIPNKCPTCGKFVAEEKAFYTKESASDLAYVIPCCKKECADTYAASLTQKKVA